MRPQKLSTLFIATTTNLKRDFDSLKKTNAVPQRVVSIQFVDEWNVTEVFEDHREVHIDEYETDSDDEESDFEEHSELVNRACVT